MHTGDQSGDHESDFTGGLLSMSAIKGRPYEQLIKHQLSQRYRKWQRCSTLICAAARRCLFHTLVLRTKMTFRILLGKNFKLCRPNEKRLDVLNATESKNMRVLLCLQNGELVGYIVNLCLLCNFTEALCQCLLDGFHLQIGKLIMMSPSVIRQDNVLSFPQSMQRFQHKPLPGVRARARFRLPSPVRGAVVMAAAQAWLEPLSLQSQAHTSLSYFLLLRSS